MYDELLGRRARRGRRCERFTRAYEQAAATITLAGLRAGRVRDAGGDVSDGVRVPRAAPRDLRHACAGRSALPVVTEDDRAGVDWRQRRWCSPACAPASGCARTTRLPPRGTLQARDGTVIAEGEDRTTELDPGAPDIKGAARRRAAGPRRRRWPRRACPAGAQVGLTGLEREFDDAPARHGPAARCARARGSLARSTPGEGRAGADHRRSRRAVQKAAVDALGDRYGGIAVLRPDRRRGARARRRSPTRRPSRRARCSRSSRSPARCEAGAVKPSEPTSRWRRSTTLEGVQLQNANGEACGGTLRGELRRVLQLGVRAARAPSSARRRLVPTAERFGFNQRPALVGAARLDDPARGGDRRRPRGRLDRDRPGRGARHAARDGRRWPPPSPTHGRRRGPTLRKGDDPSVSRATTPRRRAHGAPLHGVGGDRRGTGVAAKIDGVRVAGKTGTAELRTTCRPSPVRRRRPRPAADGRQDRHGRLVRRLRPGRAPARGGRGPAGRRGRGRRDGGAGGQAGAAGRAEVTRRPPGVLGCAARQRSRSIDALSLGFRGDCRRSCERAVLVALESSRKSSSEPWIGPSDGRRVGRRDQLAGPGCARLVDERVDRPGRAGPAGRPSPGSP